MFVLFDDFVSFLRKVSVPNWALALFGLFLLLSGLWMYALATLIITLLFMLPTIVFLGGIDIMAKWASNDLYFQQKRRKRKRRQPSTITPAQYVARLSRLSDADMPTECIIEEVGPNHNGAQRTK
jgi:hypothetical protein